MHTGETLNSHVAGEIRAELARRRMTARELAEKVGVRRMWVQYRLSGTTPIQLDDLHRIAEALDMPVVALLPQPVQQGARMPAPPPPRVRRRGDITESFPMTGRSHSVTKAVKCTQPSGRSTSKGASRSTRRPVILPAHAADTTQ